MKKKQHFVIGSVICFSLMLFGCGTGTSDNVNSALSGTETTETEISSIASSTVPGMAENPDSTSIEQGNQPNGDDFQYDAEHLDDEELSKLEKAMADGTLTEEQRALAIAAGYLSETEEVGENADNHADISGYPSTEEILACIDAGESKLYWCAETPDYSGTMDIQPIETPDAGNFASDLSDILGDGYSISESSEGINTITITPDGADPDMETVLSALSQLTGTEYVEINPEEIYAAEYVPALNGYGVDAEGYPYGSDGDYFVGSSVCVGTDGVVSVVEPVVLSGTAETIDTSELVTPETVETICQGYYENYGIPSSVVVTDITLGYYYSGTEQKLLPAWQCETTLYMSENGHSDSVLLDAQTGELLRK